MLKTFRTNFQKLFGGNSNNIQQAVKMSESINNQYTTQPLHNVDVPFEKATFGMGCFWGSESLFGATRGVLRTRVGYSGGNMINPVYRNLGDHTEVLEIDFDPKMISFYDLLQLFWNNHEYGLCTKTKTQYMSLVLTHSEEQKRIFAESLEEEQQKRPHEKIGTQVRAAGAFYPAEDYHQKYRLQGHKDLVKALGITSKLLQTSTVAAKLNGYLVGVGGVNQFLNEADSLGLTEKQIEYVREYVEKFEGNGLFC